MAARISAHCEQRHFSSYEKSPAFYGEALGLLLCVSSGRDKGAIWLLCTTLITQASSFLTPIFLQLSEFVKPI